MKSSQSPFGYDGDRTMVKNPYSPPDDPKDPPRSGAVLPPRRSEAPASMLVLVLLGSVALATFRISLYVGVGFSRELLRQSSEVPFVAVFQWSWVLSRFVLLAAVVAFCVWLYRVNRDARTLGSEGMIFTPGWTVAACVVPVLNLVAPYRAVREVYQASDPESDARDWEHAHVPLRVALWWTLWVASIAWYPLSRVVLPASAAPWLVPFLEGLRAVAALTLVSIVRAIDRRLELKALLEVRATETPTPAPPEPVAVSRAPARFRGA